MVWKRTQRAKSSFPVGWLPVLDGDLWLSLTSHWIQKGHRKQGSSGSKVSNKFPLFSLLNCPVSTTMLSWVPNVRQSQELSLVLTYGQVYLKHAGTGHRKQGSSGRQVSNYLSPPTPQTVQGWTCKTVIEGKGHTGDWYLVDRISISIRNRTQ